RRPDEHGVHEKGVVGARADDANLDAILGVPAREAVETVHTGAGVEIIAGALPVDGKRLRVERNVHRTPPDAGLRVRVPDDALVLGRAARLDAGVGDQGAVLRDTRVALVADGVLVELTGRKVAVDLRDGDPILLKIELTSHCLFPFLCTGT